MNKELIILVAHYNNPEGLYRTLFSINEKIMVDVMIVDDGSQQQLDENFLKQKYKGGKLYFEYLRENSGVGVASNHGLEKTQKMGYKYIGRLDCGDLCLENKFGKQLNYLNSNPQVKLLGTWVNVVDENKKLLYVLKHPVKYNEIKKKMYLNSMFVNPSVVFASDILEKVGNYPYKYRHASQDYAFFFKIVKKFEAENYPEVLLDYVVEENSISTKKRFLQVKNRIKIIQDNFYLGYYPIVGLLRNFILLFASRNFTNTIKKLFRN